VPLPPINTASPPDYQLAGANNLLQHPERSLEKMELLVNIAMMFLLASMRSALAEDLG
jgi:hypothetical protein